MDIWPLLVQEQGCCLPDSRQATLLYMKSDICEGLFREKEAKNGGCSEKQPPSACRKSRNASDFVQEPRRVPSSADDGIKSICFFRRHMRRKKHFSACKRARWGPEQSPAKRVCLGEEGQGSGVNPGRQAGANGADFDPTKCAQRPASPRKNACIFEKRVERVRHAGRVRMDAVSSIRNGRNP